VWSGCHAPVPNCRARGSGRMGRVLVAVEDKVPPPRDSGKSVRSYSTHRPRLPFRGANQPRSDSILDGVWFGPCGDVTDLLAGRLAWFDRWDHRVLPCGGWSGLLSRRVLAMAALPLSWLEHSLDRCFRFTLGRGPDHFQCTSTCSMPHFKAIRITDSSA
jgi:hypothetical protein